MAQITNLICGHPQDSDPASIAVSCDLLFGTDEDGKPFRIAIELVAEDTILSLLGPEVLYTFHFGGWPLPPKPYKMIIGEVGGVHISEARSIARGKFNEDPEVQWIVVDPNTPPLPLLEADEFRARVTVSQMTQAVSDVQSILV